MNNTGDYDWAVNMMSPPLSEREKALRDLFVSEYFKDYDAVRACIRMGFKHGFAEEYSRKLFFDSYVQKQIADKTLNDGLDSESEVEKDRALIINVLREASQAGPYNSRVSAARELRELRGFTTDRTADVGTALVDAFKELAQKVPV